MSAKRWMGVVGSVLFLVGISRSDAAGTAGQLDAGFGTGGVVRQPVATGSSIEVVAQQSTGKLVTGRRDSNGWWFRRYLVDGTLDTTFGVGGAVSLFGTSSGSFEHMAVDSSDRIVAVGRTAGTPPPVTIVRLNSEGSLDATFGSGGVAQILVSGSPLAQAVAIQADGSVVVAGGLTVTTTVRKKTTSSREEFVLRTTPSGSLDTSFGVGGVAVNATIANYDVYPGALAIQSSGDIVVGGRQAAGGSLPWILTRFHANGSIDTAFGTVTRAAYIRGIALDTSDRILVCGWAGNPSPVLVARYLPGGAVDTTYGSGGLASASNGMNAGATAIRVANGLAYVTAALGASPSVRTTAVRFLGDGTVDSGFGSGGFAQLVGEPGIDYDCSLGVGAVVDGVGNVVAVGERQVSSPRSTEVFLARWLVN